MIASGSGGSKKALAAAMRKHVVNSKVWCNSLYWTRVYDTDPLTMRSLMEHAPTTGHRDVPWLAPSIIFPAIASSATQDPLTTIRDQVSGVMIWSVGLPPGPHSLGTPLRGPPGWHDGADGRGNVAGASAEKRK